MSEQRIRSARRDDVPALVGMLADDPLGATREDFTDPLPEAYYAAFETVDGSPMHDLLVLEEAGEVLGTLQLSFQPGLSFRGGTRGQIEAVRVHADHRGRGLGEVLILDALERARARGCLLVQLTTDRERTRALAFYERLGFKNSHHGLKLRLGEHH